MTIERAQELMRSVRALVNATVGGIASARAEEGFAAALAALETEAANANATAAEAAMRASARGEYGQALDILDDILEDFVNATASARGVGELGEALRALGEAAEAASEAKDDESEGASVGDGEDASESDGRESSSSNDASTPKAKSETKEEDDAAKQAALIKKLEEENAALRAEQLKAENAALRKKNAELAAAEENETAKTRVDADDDENQAKEDGDDDDHGDKEDEAPEAAPFQGLSEDANDESAPAPKKSVAGATFNAAVSVHSQSPWLWYSISFILLAVVVTSYAHSHLEAAANERPASSLELGASIVRAEKNVSAKEIGREMSVNDEFWKSSRPSSPTRDVGRGTGRDSGSAGRRVGRRVVQQRGPMTAEERAFYDEL
ncbi:predicted protein [Ostreococcus lucimarinus CCE9901]|jgi:hypothetical protein|uniref:Uncharacterized protein n=1 Tax=Ostreococcus lucimarinus (strain CCE9901) TaxID=436017 RepID=A4RTJ4_OSTLU|nr:predicted protein [Ostreococcus lucimarinus CCE9901]ABO94356.1 predicted protein [Ostreococcus lucimarinus CCE9901]|eukprot:XP_001416064.1 predicted protein [Ostreococcus lucimarinus CCE9901]